MKPLKSILLIEDDECDQFFFAEALREIKNAILYKVANNGKEALNILENSFVLPDLIFTDIHMPIMDGVECLSAIVKNPQMKNIPVIGLSTDTGKIEDVRKLGAKAFIKKPDNGKLLRERIEEMVNLDFMVDGHLANQTFQTDYSVC